MTDYKKIGFKCGVEIHNRLATKTKLFCSCKPSFSSKKSFLTIKRKQRVVPGESGKIDAAAKFEFLQNKTFHYHCFHDESCLVETDSEPPHPLSKEALEVAIQIAKIFHADIPDEIHIMRKMVIDGSNTSSFQRTALIGTNGILKTSKGDVGIDNICLEEESAGIVSKENSIATYRLDRLGIPLIEIGTAPDIKDPNHAKEVAEKIGMIIRSTGKSQRGIGVTRQDVNVSIRNGERVEIKGFQDLDSMPTIIENEILRQQKLVLAGASKEETRTARKDGTTIYTRPLPGGERMYPETDIFPIQMDKKYIASIKIPESWEAKIKRFEKHLPKGMAEQIVKSEHLTLFEEFSKDHDPKTIANMLLSVVKDLKRKEIATEKLIKNHFESVLIAIKNNKISKEIIPDILEKFSHMPEKTIGEIIAEMGIEQIDEHKLRLIVKRVIDKNPKLVEQNKIGGLMGDVMKEVKGKVDGKTVKRILDEELKCNK
jgi:Glu-tRNA(Gln) amidotransferase subunit E-like FAD-binding protein